MFMDVALTRLQHNSHDYSEQTIADQPHKIRERMKYSNFLGICLLLQVLTTMVALQKCLITYYSPSESSAKTKGSLPLDRTHRSQHRFLRPPRGQAIEKETSDTLKTVNAPKFLPWNVASKAGPLTAVVPVDFAYTYNPSVLELANGSHIFAGRMSWLYGGDCHKFVDSKDTAIMYNCLRTHKHRFADQTVLGVFHPSRNELEILAPSNAQASVPEFDIQIRNIEAWNGGPGWFDTRLIYPYNHRYQLDDGNGKKEKMFMTSQNTELLGNKDWFELYDSSTLALQVTYIGIFDPEILLFARKEDRVDWVKNKRMSRWLFYDAEMERKEFENRQQGLPWTPMVADVARLKCKTRPDHLPSLPFDPTQSVMHRKANHSSVEKQHPQQLHQLPSINHRRLAALEGDDWLTIKDKNWTPFVYKERILWSYSLEPHVVCENDIDLNLVEDFNNHDDIDCVLCVAKYKSTSPRVFKAFYDRLRQEGHDKVVSHLNGAPSFYIQEMDAYLGIMHVIKTVNFNDPVGRRIKKRVYEHYFYTTEAVPPFRVTQIAVNPAPIKPSRVWSPWFATDDIVDAAFVMNMQYHPDRLGQELVVSYGDGDRYSRIQSISLSDVLETFHQK